MARGVEARPRLETRIAGILWGRVQDPLELAGARIEGLEERRRVEIVTRADEHMIADDHRRVRREVLLIERCDLVLPDFLARLRIQAHDPVVMELEVNIVVPHAQAARLQARAATRLPVVVPQQRAIARVDRVHIVRTRGVNDAVDEQNPATEASGVATVCIAITEAADIDWRCGCAATTAAPAPAPPAPAAKPCSRVGGGRSGWAAPGGETRHPLEAEIFDRARVHQLQRAEAFPAQIA